jgi:hypothetical protein
MVKARRRRHRGCTRDVAIRRAPAEKEEDMDVPRISPAETRRRVQQGQALLVCGYEDESKCRSMALEGSIGLADLKRRIHSLPKGQNLIFYCA